MGIFRGALSRFNIDRFFGNSLGARTRVLVFNIASGLISVGIVFYIGFFTTKYDFDHLFASYALSLDKLENIRSFYNQQLLQPLLVFDNPQIPIVQKYKAQEYIKQTLNSIQKEWEEFKNLKIEDTSFIASQILQLYLYFDTDKSTTQKYHQLNLNEKDSITDLEKLLHSTNAMLVDIINLKDKNEIQNYHIRLNTFQLNLQNINANISRLSNIKLKIAQLQKKQTDSFYVLILTIILIMIAAIIIITLFLSSLILRNIKSLHHTLEKAVAEKTKELQQINENLQRVIEEKVNESRKKDQIMYQQARLASMGEMIENIAHQWRQPLNALTMLIQSFKTKSQLNRLTPDFIEEQVEHGLRIAKTMSKTIDDFRNFFASNNLKENFGVLETIYDSLALVSGFLKQNEISVSIKCKEEILLMGYKNAFSQVVLNLLKNSQDALVERKVYPAMIEIILTKESLQQNNSLQDYAKITFRDNAGGIKLQDIQKVFEPYFTTKHQSVGTGIGLYMSKQIIEKQMEGSINVSNATWSDGENEEFFGAEFTLLIPLIQKTT